MLSHSSVRVIIEVQIMWITRCSIAHRLELFVALVAFHGRPSIARVPANTIGSPYWCYQCIAFEGINNPTCEFPVARKAPIKPCSTMKDDDTTSKCAKIVLYAKAYKKGQTLKSWLMKRECVVPMSLKDRYDNLDLECDTCGRVKNTVRIFQRIFPKSKGWHPKLILPDEQEQLVILMCVCCKPMCNAEEGFNLTYYDLDKRRGGSTPLSSTFCPTFLFSLQFILYAWLN